MSSAAWFFAGAATVGALVLLAAGAEQIVHYAGIANDVITRRNP